MSKKAIDRSIGFFRLGQLVNVFHRGKWILGTIVKPWHGHGSDEVSVCCEQHVDSAFGDGWGLVVSIFSENIKPV